MTWITVESVSIRKQEIDASMQLVQTLRGHMLRSLAAASGERQAPTSPSVSSPRVMMASPWSGALCTIMPVRTTPPR